MAILRSRRLEALFGGSIEAVTVDRVRALVDVGATEAFDLDFKESHYGRSDADRRALCGDVAALANTAGGLIVIGVAEDDQARASSAPGVLVTDAEVARIRQVVAGGVSPLPTFDVMAVLDDDDPSGFIVVVVPKSVLAPHAVLVNESLRFPTRNGATTRYLSEPEVAAAYRTRLAAAAERSERQEVVEAELLAYLDASEDPWVVVSLVPELPGQFDISTQTFKEFEDHARNVALVPLDGGDRRFGRMDVGHNRLRADDGMHSGDAAPWSAATELHTDGSGVVALRLWNLRRGVEPKDPDSYVVSDEGVAAAITGSLTYLAHHADVRAHASGIAAIRARLVPAAVVKQLSLGHTRGGFPKPWGRPALSLPAVSTFAPIDELAGGDTGLTSAAARLLHSVGNIFGLPELPQLTSDGAVSWAYWSHERRHHVRAWCEAQSVPIIGLPE